MTDSQVRLVHKGAPLDDGVAIGKERPDSGRAEVVVTCPTCEERVAVAVLSRSAVRREKVLVSVACLVAAGAGVGGTVWVFRSGAVHDGFGLLAMLVVLIAVGVWFERTVTMDDGVRLKRAPAHALDRPGWTDWYQYEFEATP
ncbi:hypothetical protein ACQEVZ_52255 [Dactylosporangium sp. CA-152071]|uniref:hypothetical protein n=1 Tax=Dactylosporangium sp. CA-152071 TaxID=3239933 RepID=UPI003D8D21AA